MTRSLPDTAPAALPRAGALGVVVCLEWRVQTALVALTRVAPSVTGSAEAISLIAMGFSNLAAGRDGREACVRARVAPALVALALLPAVKMNADAAWSVTRVSCPAPHNAPQARNKSSDVSLAITTRPQALLALAETDDGRTACAAAGAVAALEALAAQQAVQANKVVAAALEDALRKVRPQACCAVQ